MPYKCKSPVLFLVFNRPEVTEHVFEAIRQAKPSELYVAADGPRIDREGEAEICRKVREIATAVDWDCDIKTLFRDQNMGCGKAVSEAITWFFDNVDEGIILEDDCLPHDSFFEYCDLMLEKCREDESVWSITGTKFKCYPYSRKLLGYKSEVFFCWGWATWRDRWQHYTRDLDELLPIKKFSSSRASKYWSRAAEAVEKRQVDTWDYQFALLAVKHLKKHIVPPCNLVKNIGFGESSTHTKVIQRHYLDQWVAFDLSKRSHFRNTHFFDKVYYGQFCKHPLIRYLHYVLMYTIHAISTVHFSKRLYL